MIRVEIRLAALAAALGRLPGHLAERVAGVYIAGWGLTALLADEMFENGPRVYSALSAGGAPEWRYGIVFALVGVAQVAFAGPERGADSRVGLRRVAAVAAMACLVGLALAFAESGAWSGAYTYGMGAAAEAVVILRLSLLRYAERQGLEFHSATTFSAVRPQPAHPQPA